MKTVQYFCMALLCHALSFAVLQSQQILLTKEWSTNAGTQNIFKKSRSRTDAAGNVYVIGETVNGNGNYDWLIEKYTATGALDWSSQVNGAADLDDYIADIFIDASYNVYVVGAVVQNASDSLDICVRKYTSTGSVAWTQYHNGPDSRSDAGTSVYVDAGGNVFITGTQGGDANMQDCITRKYNSSGVLQWSQVYDYTGLHDAGAFVQISPGLSNVLIVTAGSQGSALSWDVATILYNATTGALFGSSRISGGTGTFYEVSDAVLDPSGNLYIAGSYATLLGDVDIKVIKVNSNYTLAWEETYAGPVTGGEDKGNAVRVDGSGNVYVTGHVTRNGQGKNLVLLKYNSGGTLQYAREYNGAQDGDDAGNAMTLNTAGHIFIAGHTQENANTGKDYLTVSYDAAGNFRWRKTFDGAASLDDMATDIAIGDNQSIIVTGQCTGGAALQFTTVKWEEYVSDTAIVMDVNNVPLYKAHEVIVSFNAAKVKPGFVNDADKQYGRAQDVLDSVLITQMNTALGLNLFTDRDVRFIKMSGLKTTDTISISRGGYPVKVPKFWSSFVMTLPGALDENTAISNLEALADVHYAELNITFQLSGSNDPIFNSGSSQSSIKPHPLFPDAHINADSAWVYGVGKDWVKVGIVDNGLYYIHEDFGNASNGSFAGSKIMGGENFVAPNVALTQIPPPQNHGFFFHGTPVAGIIGALRNNNKGIAGIAGGDPDSSTTGVALYDLRVCCNVNSSGSEALLSQVTKAIEQAAMSGSSGANGMHILNIAVNAGANISNGKALSLRNRMRWAKQNEVIMLVSRGNLTNPNDIGTVADTMVSWPATIDEKLVINVGASGNNGQRLVPANNPNGGSQFSVVGRGMDFLAPGALQNVQSPSDASFNDYSSFQGTSSAVAHATGAAALLYSYFEGKTTDPNNLNIEDVEHILEYTADNKATLTPHTYTRNEGWGIINVKKALDVLQKPYYSLLHFTAWLDSSFMELSAANVSNVIDGITFVDYDEQGEPKFNPGQIVDQYKISYTFDHSTIISPSAQILGYWPRNSFSDAWGTFNVGSQRKVVAWPDITIDFLDNDSAVLHGYLYNTPFIGNAWYPFLPTASHYMRLSYSVHVYDPTGVTHLADEKPENEVVVYPNPAQDQAALGFTLHGNAEVKISVIDLQGRTVMNLPEVQLPGGNNIVQLPLNGLAPGNYFVRVGINGKETVRKLVKI